MLARRVIVLLALVAVIGCRTVLHTTPATPAEVRTLTEHADVEGETPLQVQAVTDRGSEGMNVKVRDVAEKCRPRTIATAPLAPPKLFHGCLLDDPRYTWEVGTHVRVPDLGLVLRTAIPLVLVGGLVVGNVECFAGNCGTGAKIAVGIGDGVIVVGVVAFVVFLTAMAHYD